jgi:colanic acid biosynthesis glycosyl transferase WcaI
MKSKRVVCLNRFFGDPQVPTARMLDDVVRELGQALDVTVVASRGTYVDRNGGREWGVLQNVHFIKVWNCGNRVVDWLWYWLCASFIVVFRRWDACLVLTDPPFLNVLSLLCRRPVIFWVMDLYPDALIAHQIIKPGSLAHRIMVWLNRRSMARMAKVICLDEAQVARCKRYADSRCDLSKFTVIGPWDNRGIGVWTGSKNRFREKFGLEGRTIVLYAGNLGAAHHWESVVDAASVCQREGLKEWSFVFAVRGQRVPALVATVEKRGLTNVVVCDYQPADLTEEMFGAASVHLITLRDGWEGIVVPSKLYGLVGSGKPIIFVGPASSGSCQEIVEGKFGSSLPADADGRSLLSVLQAAIAVPQAGDDSRFRGRARQVAEIVASFADRG